MPADPWSRGYNFLDLHCIVVFDSRWCGSAAMNPFHDALRDLTALTELKSDGWILERQFLQLKEHVTKGHLVGTSSLEGMRMSLQLRRIGGTSEEEHAADVDGKVAEILKNNDCVEDGGGLWNACCTTPSVCLQQEGQTSCGQLRICTSQPAKSTVFASSLVCFSALRWFTVQGTRKSNTSI